MLSVIDALNATKGYVRPMREGEQIMKGGLVVSIGKKGKKEDVVHVQGLVLRTSGLQSKDPAVVEIWVDLSKEYGQRVVKDNEEELSKHCDCPAGNSQKCKHIVAVMLCLANLEEEELEDLSCTDTERQWGALKASTIKDYEAKPLRELCHVKGKRDVYVSTLPAVTKEMEERWRVKLMSCAALSEYSIFRSTLRSGMGLAVSAEDEASQSEERKIILKRLLTFRTWCVLAEVRKMTEKKLQTIAPQLCDFYETHVSVSCEKSVEICLAEQGSPDWQYARKLRQTASKARAQYTYYVNKKANWNARYKELFHSTFRGNTIRGLEDEPLCREKYENKNGCKVLESGLLVRPELLWLSASLDGTVLDNNGQFVRNIEIKSFKEGLRLSASELVEINAVPTLDMNGNVKKTTQHYAQMQLGMLVSGLSECDYLMYSRLRVDYAFVRVPFDGVYVLDLCSRLVNVYFETFLPKIAADHVNN